MFFKFPGLRRCVFLACLCSLLLAPCLTGCAGKSGSSSQPEVKAGGEMQGSFGAVGN